MPVEAFAQRWKEWKEESGLMDFTDLIETCLEEVSTAPGNPNVVFVDEAQDLDLLEMSLIRKWGQKAGSLYIVGDPDQCQPAGTRVETATGPVDIEDLDPEKHQILTWDRHSQAVLGQGKRYEFEKAVRSYAGKILAVTAGEKSSLCTPEHRWLVKWTNRDTGTCCTYLMRQGSRWRVGWCQIFNSEGTLHLGQRATIENADEAWILSTSPDRKESSVNESILATRYGLPTATFSSTHIPPAQHDRIWASLDAEEQGQRARQCLADHGREMAHPIWTKGSGTPRAVARVQERRSCNLLPGLMSLPSHGGGRNAPLGNHHRSTATRTSREMSTASGWSRTRPTSPTAW